MVTCRVKWVAIIFIVCANIYRVLAEFSVICLTLARAFIQDFVTVAFPGADLLIARGIVHAWATLTLINIYVAISSHVALATLHDCTLLRILLDE